MSFDKRQARIHAKFRAGLILDSVLAQGWGPEDLVEKCGQGYVDFLAEEISKISQRLIRSGGGE